MNTGQIWFVRNPRHYRPQSQTVSRFIALLCQSSLSCLCCQYIETYCVPLVTSGQTLLPRFLWVLHSFFFFLSCFLFPTLCVMVASSPCEKHLSVVEEGRYPPTSTPASLAGRVDIKITNLRTAVPSFRK